MELLLVGPLLMRALALHCHVYIAVDDRWLSRHVSLGEAGLRSHLAAYTRQCVPGHRDFARRPRVQRHHHFGGARSGHLWLAAKLDIRSGSLQDLSLHRLVVIQ